MAADGGRTPYGPPRALSAAERTPTWRSAAAATLAAADAALGAATLEGLATLILAALWCGFVVAVAWRLFAASEPRRADPRQGSQAFEPPSYTVLVALYREAPIAAQLVAALKRLDYPRRKLEVLFLVEADDPQTAQALKRAGLARYMKVVVVPDGRPRTKPRALNYGLAQARGELVCVFDAEDRPDPGQLREAAARFTAAGRDLACLQAPLRVRCTEEGFLQRQFAAEYAALFEVQLPFLARRGAPFPLGGTSNHFRADVLREVGAWDPWNVTEDADLAFRLARSGFRSDVIARPTWEAPPRALRVWLPQRARWLKGWVQTWAVHMREPSGLGWRAGAALQLTLGLGLLAATLHGPVLAAVTATALVGVLDGRGTGLAAHDAALLIGGWVGSVAVCREGARRAGTPYPVWAALSAPLYWALSSLALVYALAQLWSRPFHWDKTEHLPDAD